MNTSLSILSSPSSCLLRLTFHSDLDRYRKVIDATYNNYLHDNCGVFENLSPMHIARSGSLAFSDIYISIF
jgi:hypothetical protein